MLKVKRGQMAAATCWVLYSVLSACARPPQSPRHTSNGHPGRWTSPEAWIELFLNHRFKKLFTWQSKHRLTSWELLTVRPSWPNTSPLQTLAAASSAVTGQCQLFARSPLAQAWDSAAVEYDKVQGPCWYTGISRQDPLVHFYLRGSVTLSFPWGMSSETPVPQALL